MLQRSPTQPISRPWHAQHLHETQHLLATRRSLLALAAATVVSLPMTAPALASTTSLRDEQYGFMLSYPDDWVPAPKPVKTHLSESILQSPIKGVSLGVTVDPVKIASLRQFGSAEQVATRVLDTELTRDGVKDVLLRKVSAEEGEPPYYLIEYLVESSRGRKVYVCKYCIYQQRLYVLQAQAKQDTFDAANDASVRDTLAAAVSSFRVLVPTTPSA